MMHPEALVGHSFDLSAAITAWHAAGDRSGVGKRTYDLLARACCIDPSIVLLWAKLPDAPHAEKRRKVPAHYLPALAERMGMSLEELLEGQPLPAWLPAEPGPAKAAARAEPEPRPATAPAVSAPAAWSAPVIVDPAMPDQHRRMGPESQDAARRYAAYVLAEEAAIERNRATAQAKAAPHLPRYAGPPVAPPPTRPVRPPLISCLTCHAKFYEPQFEAHFERYDCRPRTRPVALPPSPPALRPRSLLAECPCGVRVYGKPSDALPTHCFSCRRELVKAA